MNLIDWYRGNELPFASLLGIELSSAEPELLTGAMTVLPQLCTAGGVAHGGAIVAFADTLGALATLSHLPEGCTTSTLETATHFVAAAPVHTRLLGSAQLVHRGRSSMIWQTRVTTEQGRLVALTTQTQGIRSPPGRMDGV